MGADLRAPLCGWHGWQCQLGQGQQEGKQATGGTSVLPRFLLRRLCWIFDPLLLSARVQLCKVRPVSSLHAYQHCKLHQHPDAAAAVIAVAARVCCPVAAGASLQCCWGLRQAVQAAPRSVV